MKVSCWWSLRLSLTKLELELFRTSIRNVFCLCSLVFLLQIAIAKKERESQVPLAPVSSQQRAFTHLFYLCLLLVRLSFHFSHRLPGRCTSLGHFHDASCLGVFSLDQIVITLVTCCVARISQATSVRGGKTYQILLTEFHQEKVEGRPCSLWGIWISSLSPSTSFGELACLPSWLLLDSIFSGTSKLPLSLPLGILLAIAFRGGL